MIERFQGISAVFAIVAGQWYFKHIMVDPDGDPYPDGSDAEPMGASEDRVDLIVATIVAMDLDTCRHVLEANDDPTLRQWAEHGFAQLLLSRQG